MHTYIPSNQGGSLTSSMEKNVLSSDEATNFIRGAGAKEYFLATGKITYTSKFSGISEKPKETISSRLHMLNNNGIKNKPR